MVTGSGMGAISAILLPVLQQGGRIVAGNRLYGRTTQLLNQELARFGVQTTTVDSRDTSQVRTALDKPARVLFVHGPGGIGKTALAIAAGRELDGAAWVARLEGATTPDEVLDMVIAALHVSGGEATLIERPLPGCTGRAFIG